MHRSKPKPGPSPSSNPDPTPIPDPNQGFDDSNGDAFDVSLKPFLKGNERPFSLGDTIFTTAEGDDARTIRWKVHTHTYMHVEMERDGARWSRPPPTPRPTAHTSHPVYLPCISGA